MKLFDLYGHWETDLRPGTLGALRKLSPEQLHWKPEGWHSSAWDLALHMAGVEWVWVYRNALKREPWEARWFHKRFEGLDDLLPYWAHVHEATVQWLKETPVEEASRVYPLPYAHSPEATMNWIVYHVLEHEIHHRGQLFMLLRMQGVEPPSI